MSETIRRDEAGSTVGSGCEEASGGMTRRAAVIAGATLAATSALSVAGAAEQERKESQRRGSEKMIEELAGMKGGLGKSQIQDLLKVLTRGDAKLIDWHIKGIPVPEIVIGSVLAPVKTAGEMVGQIYEANLRATIRHFPIGIPPVVDQVRVEVELGR